MNYGISKLKTVKVAGNGIKDGENYFSEEGNLEEIIDEHSEIDIMRNGNFLFI